MITDQEIIMTFGDALSDFFSEQRVVPGYGTDPVVLYDRTHPEKSHLVIKPAEDANSEECVSRGMAVAIQLGDASGTNVGLYAGLVSTDNRPDKEHHMGLENMPLTLHCLAPNAGNSRVLARLVHGAIIHGKRELLKTLGINSLSFASRGTPRIIYQRGDVKLYDAPVLFWLAIHTSFETTAKAPTMQGFYGPVFQPES